MKYDLYLDNGIKKWYRVNEELTRKHDQPLSVQMIDYGIVLPAKGDASAVWALGGVLRSDYSFVEESKTPRLFGGKYEFDQNKVEYCDEEVVFMGPFLYHWGHFLCDMISRLWYVIENVETYKVAYCGWNWGSLQTEICGNYLELMKLIGLNETQLINVQCPVCFKRVIIPDLSFIPDVSNVNNPYYSNEFTRLIRKIIENSPIQSWTPVDRVYFARTNYQPAADRERGEEEIIDFFKNNGYEVFYPESMSVYDQISCWQSARQIAAISGSITHNMVFAGDDTEIILLNKCKSVNSYQFSIDKVCDKNVTYVDVSMAHKRVCFGIGPFLVGVSKHLKKFARDNAMVIPKRSFKRKAHIRDTIWYLRAYGDIYKVQEKKKLLERELQNELLRNERWIKELRR